LLGVSEFNTSPVSSDLAVEQGEKLTADIVVLYMQYTNTINTVMPITLPSTTTASTNYYNGYNNFIGSSQSTIYGQSTTYVPMVIDRYNYIATYWKKDNRKPKIGVVAVDLTDDLKGKLQTNSGCYVEVVIKDTPAFYADILRGDVIFSLNGTRIINSEHLNTILSKIKGGQQINLIIIRNGYKINKSIYLS
jgi:hypothetical protein